MPSGSSCGHWLKRDTWAVELTVGLADWSERCGSHWDLGEVQGAMTGVSCGGS